MALIPEQPTTTGRIYKWYEDTREPQRSHLGASIVGDPCQRKLWYAFRWALAESFPGRVLRLFKRGQLEETNFFVQELRAIGVTVWEVDPTTGHQFRMNWGNGHMGGSCDGVAVGLVESPRTPHLLEFKTSSKKQFDELLKKGVKEKYPTHYAQMQCYMRGLDLKRALYLVSCKDDDRIYQERVHYSATEAKEYIVKGEQVINAKTPVDLPRISEREDWYQCKFCDYAAICHGSAIPAVTCRTCAHSTPVKGGAWSCAYYCSEMPVEAQRDACSKHVYIPDLIPAQMIDASESENFIEYKTAGGVTFRNGPGVTDFTSTELHAGGLAAVDDKLANDLKKKAGELLAKTDAKANQQNAAPSPADNADISKEIESAMEQVSEPAPWETAKA